MGDAAQAPSDRQPELIVDHYTDSYIVVTLPGSGQPYAIIIGLEGLDIRVNFLDRQGKFVSSKTGGYLSCLI
jgi:hypothetical protein